MTKVIGKDTIVRNNQNHFDAFCLADITNRPGSTYSAGDERLSHLGLVEMEKTEAGFG